MSDMAMDKDRLYQIILAPIVSEKSTRTADENRQVVFSVLPGATKSEIKRAVEMAFDVEVDAVQVTNVHGKVKRFGRVPGSRKNWKKAYVKLKEGHDIDFSGGI
jgi:large subunit ribosomal protein L23